MVPVISVFPPENKFTVDGGSSRTSGPVAPVVRVAPVAPVVTSVTDRSCGSSCTSGSRGSRRSSRTSQNQWFLLPLVAGLTLSQYCPVQMTVRPPKSRVAPSVTLVGKVNPPEKNSTHLLFAFFLRGSGFFDLLSFSSASLFNCSCSIAILASSCLLAIEHIAGSWQRSDLYVPLGTYFVPKVYWMLQDHPSCHQRKTLLRQVHQDTSSHRCHGSRTKYHFSGKGMTAACFANKYAIRGLLFCL